MGRRGGLEIEADSQITEGEGEGGREADQDRRVVIEKRCRRMCWRTDERDLRHLARSLLRGRCVGFKNTIPMTFRIPPQFHCAVQVLVLVPGRVPAVARVQVHAQHPRRA